MKRSKTNLLVSLLVVLAMAASPVAVSVGQVQAAAMPSVLTSHGHGRPDVAPGITHHADSGYASTMCERQCCDESSCMQQMARNCAFHHLPMFPAQAGDTTPETVENLCPEALMFSVQDCLLVPDTPPPKPF